MAPFCCGRTRNQVGNASVGLDVLLSTDPEHEEGAVTGALAPTKPLSVADRCDRCGAQAYVRAVLVGGGDLLFCAHHGRKYAEALRANGADIQDETDRLNETPATAGDDER
jgi:hypothetical protein